jgi:hypothetical protein
VSAHALVLWTFPIVFAAFMPLCSPRVAPLTPAKPMPMSALWTAPVNLAERDLYYGEWGAEHAPLPRATYTFVRAKEGGTNPGMVVRDPLGREWNVKQPIHTNQGAEGPVEVVLSRVLSAIGYHQPPVYYLPSFTVKDTWGTRVEAGGRFRLRHPALRERADWWFQQNPFVGTRPFEGLLVTLLIFRSSDLKNTNNSLYEYRHGDLVEQWYVVRDLGAALGETGRFAPFRNDPALFERQRFVLDVRNGLVAFAYHGFHQELFRDRITVDDVRWACELLDGLDDGQWSDAFRAGGYQPAVADRFIRKLRATVAEGLQVAAAAGRVTSERR